MITIVSKLVDDFDDQSKGRDCIGTIGVEGEILGHAVGFMKKCVWSGGRALDIGQVGVLCN